MTTKDVLPRHLFQALEEAGWGVILASVFTEPNAVPLHIRTAIRELGDRLFDIQEHETKIQKEQGR